MQASPVRHLAYWHAQLAWPLEARVAVASGALVDYVRLDNLRSGYPATVQAASRVAAVRDDVRAVLRALPTVVRRKLAARLVTVALVEHLGSTGYSDEVYAADGSPAGGFIVLDTGALATTANAWASWKENTPFAGSPDWRLTATLEGRAEDDRRQAIEYIFLHEVGHILAIGSGLTPSWNRPASDAATGSWPFFRLSWLVGGDGAYHSRFDDTFSLRPRIIYYQRPRLTANDMAPAYRQLAASDFPTLYAATNPADDFAESFVNYVH
jgi:hypothetical protein